MGLLIVGRGGPASAALRQAQGGPSTAAQGGEHGSNQERSRTAARRSEAGAEAGASGVREDGQRRLLGFVRSQGESPAAWEGLLGDLYRRGLEGRKLQLIVTDGCPGLAAAIQTVYPRVLHQRCWVHPMRNILEKVRQRDYEAVKADAQAIYRAWHGGHAQRAFQRFAARWRGNYPGMVRQLERDLPELLSFFHFPRHLWKKLRTTT